MGTQKKHVDWERVEAQFRVGTMSLREIASAHGITEGAIRKRAKRDQWDRDLSAKVRAKADALVRKELVRSEVRTASPTETETIAVEAQVQARVAMAHRSDITRSRTLAMHMVAELEAQCGQIELFDQLGELLQSQDEGVLDKLQDLYRKVLSLPGRVDNVKKLAETLKTLIGLERQAFGMETVAEKVVDAFEAIKLINGTD